MAILDAVGVAAALLLAGAVRFDGGYPPGELRLVLLALPLVVGGKVLALVLFQCDRWSFQYAGSPELRRLLAAVSFGSLLSWAVIAIAGPLGVSRAVLLMEPLFSLFLLGGYRFSLRIVPERLATARAERTPSRSVLILGAGEAGVMTLREIRDNPRSDMKVVGFIDDDPGKHGVWIEGVKVLGGREQIPHAARALAVEDIILAIPSATGEQVRELLGACREVQARFRVVPGLLSIIEGRVDFERIRELRPEDLLGRETTAIDPRQFAARVRGRRTLVTGAGGSIGSELARQLAAAGAEVALLDHSETAIYVIAQELAARYPDRRFAAAIADLRDRNRLAHVLRRERPEMVFHAAACKHVPLMEENPIEAVTTNIFGTRHLVDLCEELDVRNLVFISTDKAVRPTSIMGATKRIAELMLFARPRRLALSVVRFGNVFGSSGSVVPLFRRQIEAGGPVTVTHPHVVRYFMTIPEAVFLVIQSSLLTRKKDLFVLEMGQPIRIYDLARDMITLSGYRPEIDIRIEFTGLRPGEKLYEEVLTDGEHVEPTDVKKVFRVAHEDVTPPHFEQLLGRFPGHIAAGDEDAVRSLIKEILPEYTGG